MGDSRINLRKRARRYFIRATKWLVGSIYLLIGAPGCKSKLVAFVFHEISNSPREHPRLTDTYSSEKTFIKQIQILKNNFRIVDPRELTSGENPNGCLITFDDGYEGSLSAARFLEKDGISSLHFVNLDTIHGALNSSATIQSLSLRLSENVRWTDSNPKTFGSLTSTLTQIQFDELSSFSGPYLTVNQLNELMLMKKTLIGDHFLNHWHGDSLNSDEIIENLAINSNNYIEKLGMEPFFAAPHGKMDIRKLELIANQGYGVIFSGGSWMRLSNAAVLPRIDMNNSMRTKASIFGAIAILLIRNIREAKNL